MLHHCLRTCSSSLGSNAKSPRGPLLENSSAPRWEMWRVFRRRLLLCMWFILSRNPPSLPGVGGSGCAQHLPGKRETREKRVSARPTSPPLPSWPVRCRRSSSLYPTPASEGEPSPLGLCSCRGQHSEDPRVVSIGLEAPSPPRPRQGLNRELQPQTVGRTRVRWFGRVACVTIS